MRCSRGTGPVVRRCVVGGAGTSSARSSSTRPGSPAYPSCRGVVPTGTTKVRLPAISAPSASGTCARVDVVGASRSTRRPSLHRTNRAGSSTCALPSSFATTTATSTRSCPCSSIPAMPGIAAMLGAPAAAGPAAPWPVVSAPAAPSCPEPIGMAGPVIGSCGVFTPIVASARRPKSSTTSTRPSAGTGVPRPTENGSRSASCCHTTAPAPPTSTAAPRATVASTAPARRPPAGRERGAAPGRAVPGAAAVLAGRLSVVVMPASLRRTRKTIAKPRATHPPGASGRVGREALGSGRTVAATPASRPRGRSRRCRPRRRCRCPCRRRAGRCRSRR